MRRGVGTGLLGFGALALLAALWVARTVQDFDHYMQEPSEFRRKPDGGWYLPTAPDFPSTYPSSQGTGAEPGE